MKKGVIVVNNARGAIMDTQAVADACSSGHIAGTYCPSLIFFSFLNTVSRCILSLFCSWVNYNLQVYYFP
jgi:hypothetical protein